MMEQVQKGSPLVWCTQNEKPHLRTQQTVVCDRWESVARKHHNGTFGMVLVCFVVGASVAESVSAIATLVLVGCMVALHSVVGVHLSDVVVIRVGQTDDVERACRVLRMLALASRATNWWWQYKGRTQRVVLRIKVRDRAHWNHIVAHSQTLCSALRKVPNSSAVIVRAPWQKTASDIRSLSLLGRALWRKREILK